MMGDECQPDHEAPCMAGEDHRKKAFSRGPWNHSDWNFIMRYDKANMSDWKSSSDFVALARFASIAGEDQPKRFVPG